MRNRGALRTYQLTSTGKEPKVRSSPFTLCDEHRGKYFIPHGYALVKLAERSIHICDECRKDADYE